MVEIQERLKQVLRDGNLTVADLARWFDRPDPTVRGWVAGGQVGGAQLDTAYITAQLLALERAIKRRKDFPVPRLSPTDRIAYLAKVKKRLNGNA